MNGSVLSCNVSAVIGTALVPSFSSNVEPPYQFTAGLLDTLIGPVVNEWINEQVAALNASEASIQAALSLQVLTVEVPGRFISDLGTPLPVDSIASAISLATDDVVLPSAIVDISVCALALNLTSL